MPYQTSFEALSQQITEEGQRVVELHLFVVESQWEGYWAQRIPAQTQTQDPPQSQAQAHSIVSDNVKANIGNLVHICI